MECPKCAVALDTDFTEARFLVHASHGLVRMQSMWVHESGHAVMAWLWGFPAFPGPWVTTVSPERSPSSRCCSLRLAFAAYRAWERQRAFWVVASAATLLLVLYCTLRVNHVNARQLTFAGDGACFVLGTLMILTVYAREDHPVCANQIRWALIVIGALVQGCVHRLVRTDRSSGIRRGRKRDQRSQRTRRDGRLERAPADSPLPRVGAGLFRRDGGGVPGDADP
jgi:hypothetical protein